MAAATKLRITDLCTIIQTRVSNSVDRFPDFGGTSRFLGQIINLQISFDVYVLVPQGATLSSTIQHAMPEGFGRKWEMEFLKSRFYVNSTISEIQREVTKKRDIFENITTLIGVYLQ